MSILDTECPDAVERPFKIYFAAGLVEIRILKHTNIKKLIGRDADLLTENEIEELALELFT